jgi:hypothetical protein
MTRAGADGLCEVPDCQARYMYGVHRDDGIGYVCETHVTEDERAEADEHERQYW